MSDPLYDLLVPHLPKPQTQGTTSSTKDNNELSTKYLSRLLSLRLADLTTTEPQSLTQAAHSNNVSLQALSSRSHKTTTTSASHLSTLHSTLPTLTHSINQLRETIPPLDDAAVSFASTYARSREHENATLQTRRESMLLARQSDKLTDILELPSLLSTAIASAGSGTAGSANYSQALDLFAHIKRLSIVYPDSALVRSVQAEAEDAMKSMTTNLLSSLRSQNIRLAAAIRTVGWLRRVMPELANQPPLTTSTGKSGVDSSLASLTHPVASDSSQPEGSFGALFLVSRLHTFLTMAEALAPLRDLADQETDRRVSGTTTSHTTSTLSPTPPQSQPQPVRRPSSSAGPSSHGTQTERYLKRYIEIFREQSFSTISMYRNIFPLSAPTSTSMSATETASPSGPDQDIDLLAIPSVLQQFPLHLVEIFMEVLRSYLPNVTDPAARESLLMQVLYAANSLGRLGADFSMMISLLDEETKVVPPVETVLSEDANERDNEAQSEQVKLEPEWARIIKKHRVQAARLDALATGQNQTSQRGNDIAVR